MEEKIVTKYEIVELFEKNILRDTGKGWYYNNTEVNIIAIHETEPKYLRDMFRANRYKITPKK
ncbi:MAG: hypothetical protein IE909_06285 [Campylobacterales bacterium]|nr:hypothetical protein [Campylobacterales bacterium]